MATLCDLRNKLLEQPEDKAKEIALSLELYTTGSLDIFGRESTVDLNKPYVVFDIHGLGEQLKPAGSLVITDTILNRVTLNWKRGKRTHVFIDEFHVMFENEQSGIFFNSAWRQFRKRGAYPDCYHAERGVPFGFRPGQHHALQLGVHRHAEPGGVRPGKAGEAPQYLQ